MCSTKYYTIYQAQEGNCIMMILGLKSFHRWARNEGVTSSALKEAVEEIEAGLVDADLGAGLLKKRVARAGGGKSGGFRTMLAFKKDDRCIFILGYPKNAIDNIGKSELSALKRFSKKLLSASNAEIKKMVLLGELTEVK